MRCCHCRKAEIPNTEREGLCPACDESLPKLRKLDDGSGAYATEDRCYVVIPQTRTRGRAPWSVRGPNIHLGGQDWAMTLIDARRTIHRAIERPTREAERKAEEQRQAAERKERMRADSLALEEARHALEVAGFEVLTAKEAGLAGTSLVIKMDGAQLRVSGRDLW